MKKLIIFFIALLFICGTTADTPPDGYASTTYEDVLIFINATPVMDYTVVGKTKYKNSKKNERITMGDVSGMSHVLLAIDDALEKVKKGKQEKFQAVYVKGPLKIDLINFATDSMNLYNDCIVGTKGYKKKCGDKPIYYMSRPLKDYEVVKVVEVSNWTNLGQLKYGKNTIDNFLNKLYERSCKEAKEGVDFDAIMLVDTDIVKNKGFLAVRSFDLIKFK